MPKGAMHALRPKIKGFEERETDETELKPGRAVSEFEYSPLPRQKRS